METHSLTDYGQRKNLHLHSQDALKTDGGWNATKLVIAQNSTATVQLDAGTAMA